jgi:CRISPR/Cas system-associated endoribonuclease Cas2
MIKQSLILAVTVFFLAGCRNNSTPVKRIPVAEVGKTILYYDEIPGLIHDDASRTDSIALVQNYINQWAKRKLLLLKAEENLSAELKDDVSKQLEETRANLLIYQYQRQMMLEKMDTVLTDAELENYYAQNEKAFVLTSNIVKALFIKIPVETPSLDKIKVLSRSNNQKDLQQLESLCYQFAEKFDDFNEEWVTMDRLSAELHEDIAKQEDFLKRNTFYETSDSSSVYLITIRDYRLISSLAPFEYVRNDIKRIIWNTRRLELMRSLEEGLYNEAIKENRFKIY